MLKISFLTCAIIAAQPVIEGARAGEAMFSSLSASPSLSLIWTGRFAAVAEVKAPAGVPNPPASALRQRADGNGDPDIVGSIPADAVGDSAKDISMLRGTQAMPLCALPGLVPDAAGDGLACGGARNNRWSAKASSFNYDLSNVKPDFANAITPYGAGWYAAPSAAGTTPAN